MPTISFVKNFPPLKVAVGDNLMDALLKGGRPVSTSCRGEGVCGRCQIQVIEGASHLTPENEVEVFLRSRYRLPADVRISCQTSVSGDVVVDTTYW
jgi:2Fe-2S ferredoxin